MNVMVVGRRAERRWRLASELAQPASAAMAPAVASSRLAHPASSAPDAVVLVVDGQADVGWLAGQTSRSVRRWVPVVAVVADGALERAARAAGAADVVRADRGGRLPALRAALDVVTEPCVVIHLDAHTRTG